MASGTEVNAPYGLEPINLIGGQVFAGSTRMYQIQYGYATAIFNGDFVKVVRGSVTRAAIGATTYYASTSRTAAARRKKDKKDKGKKKKPVKDEEGPILEEIPPKAESLVDGASFR